MSRSFLILGAGISGLATAWFLKQKGHRVTVLEAREQAGGNIRTQHEQGFLIERGPNSTLDSRPALRVLFDSLGIEPLTANSASKNRFVLRDGTLHPLPLGPVAFLKTPLFRASGKARLLLEPFIGRSKREETVAEFVRRRLGQEFLDWAINPFVSGVYAGDPDQLSVRAATAKVYALEKSHGSLMLGALAKAFAGRKKVETGPAGSMISFAHGMQQLTDLLSEKLGDDLVCHAPINQLERTNNQWTARSDDRHWQADELVLALPAHQVAELFRPLLPALPEPLEAISYPHVASISLGYRREQIDHPLDGFGFLIPRCTGVETLGVLFPSSIFPNRAPDNHCLLTVYIGGALNRDLATVEDDEVVQRVLRDITPLLGIKGDAVICSVNRWPEAIPQYTLGHLERIATIDSLLKTLPGVYTRANWRDGISVADCVQNAFELSEQIPPATARSA